MAARGRPLRRASSRHLPGATGRRRKPQRGQQVFDSEACGQFVPAMLARVIEDATEKRDRLAVLVNDALSGGTLADGNRFGFARQATDPRRLAVSCFDVLLFRFVDED